MKFAKLTGDEFLDELASKYGVTRKQINDVYMSYWRAIRDMVTTVDTKEFDGDFNENAFLEKYKTSVRIHGLGYLYCNADTVRRRKLYLKINKERKLKRIKEYETKKNKTNVDISDNHSK